MYLQNRIERVSGVRPHHERSVRTALLYQRPEVLSPDLLAGVVDVVAVADDGDRHAGELLDDVLEGVLFMVLAPRRDGAAGRRETQSLT